MKKNVKKVLGILIVILAVSLVFIKCYLSSTKIKNTPIAENQNSSIPKNKKTSRDDLKNSDNELEQENDQKKEDSNENASKDDKIENSQNSKKENSKSDDKKKEKKNENSNKENSKKNMEKNTSKIENISKTEDDTKKENNNTENKKENIVNDQNSNTNSSESSLAVENDQLRKNIKSKYGVNVGYKDEIDGNYVNSYVNPVKQYNDQKINKILNVIDLALRKYPKNFFYEISNKWKPLTIYLVERINSSAAGLTDNRNANTVIILINTEGFLFESTLHHEMMHYIDCYLATIVGASELENSMNNYNPSGFIYGNQTNEYVYYYSSPAYFLSAYSKSNYKEDRAVLFSDMMYRSLKKDYYSLGNPINEKAKEISSQLEKYFDCVLSSKNEYWGRLIEW